MPEEMEIKKTEVILELIRQASENARTYIDLRFKHFSTFMVVNGFLGIGLLRSNELREFCVYVPTFGTFLTLLFWLLDYKTSQQYHKEKNRIKICEKMLGVTDLSTESRNVLLKASTVTNFIFAIFLIFWSILLLFMK
jgi:hypothetical protein